MNKKTDFKVGDVVAFKTGNVPMTVLEVSEYDVDVVFVMKGEQLFGGYKKETLRHFKECDVIMITPKENLSKDEKEKIIKQFQSMIEYLSLNNSK